MKRQAENTPRTSTMIEQISWEEAKTELREIVREELGRVPQSKVENDRLLTRRELARKLKISLPTLHKHINSGKFTAYKINGRVLFRYDEVMEALNKNKVVPLIFSIGK